MKSRFAITVVLLASGIAPAQTASPQPPAAQQATSTATQSTAQPNQAQPAATTPATPAPNPSQPPQARTKEEYDAYKAAAALTDPNQILAAADQFAQKYPSSELRGMLYVQAMGLFQQQNNANKEIEAGRKAIAIEPTNPIPLVEVGVALVEVTHDNDLDKEQRWAEATKYLQGAIDNLNTGLHVPPNVSPEQLKQAKDNILSAAYEFLGVIQLQKQNYAEAEADFQKAVDASKAQPVARIYLRLSVTQDSEKKYQEALANANKALQYSQKGTVEQMLAQQQQTRLQKLVGQSAAPDAASPSGPAPGAAPPTAPGTGNTPIPAGNVPPQTQPQPH